MTNLEKELEIKEADLHHKRLDSFLASKIPEYSRSLIKKFFEKGFFRASHNEKLELKKLPPLGTIIIFNLPPPEETNLKAQDIPLEILFEDEHLIIINKQAGLVVHPAPGNWDGTLVNAVLHHTPDLKGVGNEKRPGIVHRLDKGTSGVMVIAKTHKTHQGLVELFSTHDIERYYEAIVLGAKIPSEIRLESIIGRSPYNRLKMATKVQHGKNAITHLKVLEYFKAFSHVELKLETGRTHQIRVHLSELLKSPIINDELYGHPKEEQKFYPAGLRSLIKDYPHPFLHAKILGFIHPITKEKLHFETPPPEIFKDALKILQNSK